MQKAVFFDRDGTLNKTFLKDNKPYGPTDPKEIVLYLQTPSTIKTLQNSGFLIFVISNQPDIALGKINEATKLALENCFVNLLKQNGVSVNEIYYCHHHPESIDPKYPKECNCRKPKPGMLLSAAKNWGIDLKNSWMIGDTNRDIFAGNAAGCKTILLQRDYSGECFPDYAIRKLDEVVDIVIKQK